MKIAVLSDIHGNHIALRAVLDAAKKERVSRLFVLGDIVGYYYHPDKVLEMLKDWELDMVKGNHEVMLLATGEQAEDIKKQYGSGIEIAKKIVDVKMLNNLLFTKDVEVDGLKFKLCHGSPWDFNKYVYPDSPEDVRNRCKEKDYDFVLIGHSHHAFIDGKLVNSGSVGQSREQGGVADWVLIDTENESAELQEEKYDPSELIEEVKKKDPGVQYLHKVLLRKRSE